MKKLFIILIVTTVFGFTASQAMACYWDGYWGSPASGRYTQDVMQSEAYQDFLKNTTKLRGELAAKQGEYDVLMTQPNPDPKRAGKLSQEIVTLHNQLRAKAKAYNLPALENRGNYRGQHRGHNNDNGMSWNRHGCGCW
jgi:zinc resistance-associated protein